MLNIFICYRREDTRADARLFYTKLSEEFGAETVFKDMDKARPGHPYAEHIDQWIDRSGAMLVVIGQRWLNAELDGERRLDQPDDPVRREIATGLKNTDRITVIPVLVGETPMPPKSALPADLKQLADLDALFVSERHWDLDVQTLIDVLHRELGEEAVEPVGAADQVAAGESVEVVESPEVSGAHAAAAEIETPAKPSFRDQMEHAHSESGWAHPTRLITWARDTVTASEGKPVATRAAVVVGATAGALAWALGLFDYWLFVGWAVAIWLGVTGRDRAAGDPS